MMNYELFKEVIEEKFRDYMPAEYANHRVETHQVTKVNQTLDSINLVPNDNRGLSTSPSMYINNMYEHYKECYAWLNEVAGGDVLFSPDKKKCRDDFREFIEGNGWFDIQWIKKEKVYFCDTGKEDWFLLKTDAWEIKRHLELWVKAYGKSVDEKRKLLIRYYRRIYPETCRSYEKYVTEMGRIIEMVAVQVLDFLLCELTGELKDYDEAMLASLMEKAWKELSLAAAQFLAGYLDWMRDCKEMSCGWEYHFHSRGTTRDSSAYPMESFIKMAYCVFNQRAWKSSGMVQKAVLSGKQANLWLYIALHFLCGLRSSDLIRLPMPTLPVNGSELRQLISEGDYNQTYEVLESMELRIAYRAMKPNKTMQYAGVPELKVFIPETLRETMAVILGLAVSWQEKVAAGRPFLSRAGRVAELREFFGTEFTDACGGKHFSSRRANKAYLQGISVMAGDDTEPGKPKGYMLAALARSHKGGIGGLPAMTDIYLKDARFAGYSPEFIAREMFERGIFSFIPSILLEMYAGGSYTRLQIGGQTKLIREFGIRPSEVEGIVRCVDNSMQKAQRMVAEVLKKPEDIRGSISVILQRIASGAAGGKQDGIQCLMMAAGLSCKDISRKGCIGCGCEIYTKSILRYLVKEYGRLNQLRREAGQEDAGRYGFILKEMIMPALAEVVVCMKSYCPGTEMEPYLEILKGGVDGACISS